MIVATTTTTIIIVVVVVRCLTWSCCQQCVALRCTHTQTNQDASLNEVTGKGILQNLESGILQWYSDLVNNNQPIFPSLTNIQHPSSPRHSNLFSFFHEKPRQKQRKEGKHRQQRSVLRHKATKETTMMLLHTQKRLLPLLVVSCVILLSVGSIVEGLVQPSPRVANSLRELPQNLMKPILPIVLSSLLLTDPSNAIAATTPVAATTTVANSGFDATIYNHSYKDPFHPLCKRRVEVSADGTTFNYRGTAVGPKDDLAHAVV